MDNYRAYLTKLIDRRVKRVADYGEKVKQRYVNLLPDQVDPEQPDRLWLEEQIKGRKYGLDVACGDFILGDSYGVDGDKRALGMDFLYEGDELLGIEPGKLDYIVTNYLEPFATPMKVLNEWYRGIAKGGILAIVCRDADAYDTKKGPLDNERRLALYTAKTLSMYLYRAGFSKVRIEKNAANKTLRCVATK